VPAETEVGLDAILRRRHPQLLEARDLALRERVVAEVGESRAAPERERLREQLGRVAVRAAGERAASFVREPFEMLRVELVGLDPEPVGAAFGRQAIADDLPNLRDVDLEGVRRGRGSLLTPEVFDQEIGRNQLVAAQEEKRKQRTRLAAFDRRRRPLDLDLERAENAEFQRLPPPVTDRNANLSAFLQGLVGAS
jgi:hypothetical protein